MKQFLLIAALLLVKLSLRAQEVAKPLGSWTTVNANYALDKKWALWCEMQLRSQEFYNHFFYYETKGGIQYSINKQATVLVGAGRYMTYTDGGNFKEISQEEIRTWVQFSLQNNLGRLKIEHRYRIEQQWLNKKYRNRFRYRLSAIVPLNHEKTVPNTVFLTANDEIFLTDDKPHFLRNRLFVGAGYVFSKGFTMQTGVLRQFDNRANGSTFTRNFLQTTFLFSIKEFFPDREVHPSSMD